MSKRLTFVFEVAPDSGRRWGRTQVTIPSHELIASIHFGDYHSPENMARIVVNRALLALNGGVRSYELDTAYLEPRHIVCVSYGEANNVFDLKAKG